MLPVSCFINALRSVPESGLVVMLHPFSFPFVFARNLLSFRPNSCAATNPDRWLHPDCWSVKKCRRVRRHRAHSLLPKGQARLVYTWCHTTGLAFGKQSMGAMA